MLINRPHRSRSTNLDPNLPRVEVMCAHCGGTPIHARPMRWCRRYAWPVGFVATIGAVLGVLLVMVLPALHEARESQRQTLEQLAHSREVIDRWYTGVGSMLPLYPDVQHELLSQAAAEYERFVKQGFSDPGLEAERARTYLRLVAIRRQLGQPDAAEEAGRTAEAVFQRLLIETPTDRNCRLGLAQSRAALALLAFDRRGDQVTDQLHTSINQLEVLVGEDPSDTFAQETLATNRLNYGTILVRSGQPQAAESPLEKAVELFKLLHDAAPSDPRYLANFATTQTTLGAAFRDQDRLRESEHAIGLATGLLDELIDPENPNQQLMDTRSETYTMLASVQSLRGMNAAALDSLKLAADGYAELAALFPTLTAREKVATAMTDLGQASYEAGACHEAHQQLQAARLLFTQLVDSVNLHQHREQLATTSDLLGRALADLGLNEEALAATEFAIEHLNVLVENSDEPSYERRLAIAESHRSQISSKLERLLSAAAASSRAVTMIEAARRRTAQAEDFDRSTDQTFALILSHRARLLDKLGNRQGAEEAAQRCRAIWEDVAASSNSPALADQLARFLSQDAIPSQRDPAAAETWARQAVLTDPRNADFHSTLALALYRASDPSGAIESVSRAERLRQVATGRDRFTRCLAYLAIGEQSAAEEEFQLGCRWMDDYQPDRPELLRLRKECQSGLE
jgi:tetratricopeptide (TPR) repeat protein